MIQSPDLGMKNLPRGPWSGTYLPEYRKTRRGTVEQSGRGELLLGPGELGEKVELDEPHREGSGCPGVRG